MCPVVRELHPEGIVGHCMRRAHCHPWGGTARSLDWYWILEGGLEGSLLIQRTAAGRARVPSPVVSSADAEKATPGDQFPPVVGESEGPSWYFIA